MVCINCNYCHFLSPRSVYTYPCMVYALVRACGGEVGIVTNNRSLPNYNLSHSLPLPIWPTNDSTCKQAAWWRKSTHSFLFCTIMQTEIYGPLLPKNVGFLGLIIKFWLCNWGFSNACARIILNPRPSQKMLAAPVIVRILSLYCEWPYGEPPHYVNWMNVYSWSLTYYRMFVYKLR